VVAHGVPPIALVFTGHAWIDLMLAACAIPPVLTVAHKCSGLICAVATVQTG